MDFSKPVGRLLELKIVGTRQWVELQVIYEIRFVGRKSIFKICPGCFFWHEGHGFHIEIFGYQLFHSLVLNLAYVIFKIDDQLNLFAPGGQKRVEVDEYDKKQPQDCKCHGDGGD